jgi:hypothetical protein
VKKRRFLMYCPSTCRACGFVRLAFLPWVILLFTATLLMPGYAQAPEGKRPASKVSYLETPLAFEASSIRDERGSLFSAKGHGYAVDLREDGARIELPGLPGAKQSSPAREIALILMGSDPSAQVTAESRLPGVSNYVPSSEPSTWRLGVPGWARVNYHHVYPGVDLSFYGQKQLLEYDFRLQPKTDLKQIRLTISGVESASLDAQGDLHLKLRGEEVRFLKPVSYQTSAAGDRVQVDSRYLLQAPSADQKEWQVSFAVGPHDESRALVIDPVLSYGLQLAYVDYNIGAIAVDTVGNTYVTGQNQTRGFYVSKYTSAGALVFNDVIGSGLVTCYPTGIAIDSVGKAYVVGAAGAGLPTTANAYQTATPSSKTYYNAPFVAVIPAAGTAPTYLSYLGGTNNYDYSAGVALDSSNNIYVAGYESSTNFPTTTGAILSTFPGSTYATFVSKINPTLSGSASLVYSTLLGTSGISSIGTAIATDASGNAYVAVQSNQGYPVTTGAYSYAGGYSDAYTPGSYVTKINPTGTAILYSAYLGPGAITGIAVDTSLDAYTTGSVYADDFPTTAGAYQTSYPGGFVTELNPAGSSLLYSTFLSGPSGAFSPASNSVFPQSIALAPGCASSCAAYVGGYTSATDFPAINPLQSAVVPNNYGPNAFIAEIAGNGASSLFSSYLGGITATVTSPFSTPIFPTPAIGVDGSGNIHLGANISGTDMPSTLAHGTQIPSSYLATVSPAAGGLIIPYPQSLNFDSYNTSGQAIGVSSTLSGIPVPLLLRNLGSAPVTISSLTFTPATQFSETDSCEMTIPAGGTCTLNMVFTPTTKGVQTATLAIASNATVTPVSIALNGTGVAAGYLQVSTAALTLPDIALGGSSAQQTITVTNIGKTLVNLQPFTLNSVRANWGNGSDFQVLSNCPAQLAVAASCTIGVTFTPLATGPRAAYFYLSGDGFGNQYIYLYGTGIVGTSQGTVSLSAAVLNFNTQLINTPSPRQSLTLTNTSTAPISIYGVTIATTGQTGTSDFAITSGSCVNTAVIQVSPQASCSVSITYTPKVAAAETGTISFSDSATGTPQVVSLTGVGLAATQSLEFTPGNSVFPDQPLGVPSTTQYFYVYNTGTAPVAVDRVLVTGDFSIISTSCAGATLKPNPAPGYEPTPNCNVRVAFTPTATGARTGTLTFVDSVGATPQVLNLSGTGITATGGIFLEPTSLQYPVQAVGTTSVTQHLNIANPGNSPTTITNITTTGNYALADTCASGIFPYILGALRNCGVDITFTPTTITNPNKGSVVVTSSAGTATLPIAGSGVAATIAIGLTPTSLNFGNVVTAAQSFGYNVYVRNTGTEGITLTSGTITGTNAADYLFSAGSCGFYGNILVPGATCYVQVYLTPSAAGTRAGTLSLTDSAGTQTAALTGIGVAALTGVQPLPTGVGFDQVTVGNTSVSNISVTLHNYAATSLAVTSAKITAGGSAFLIPVGLDNCTGATVAASSSCYVQLAFSPTAAGYQTGTLTFTDSKSVNYTVALAGYSPAVATSSYLDPVTLAFPGQVLTTISTTQAAYLYNTSDLSMTVGTLTGTNTIVGVTTTGAFSLGSTQGGYDGCSGVVVAPRSKCQVNVAFAPTVTGAATGTIVFPVTYSNSTTTQFSLALSGTGLAVKDSAELTPAAISFQDQAVGAVPGNGADATQNISLFNAGNLPFVVGALTGTDAVVGTSAMGDFTTASAFSGYDGCTNQTVSPNATCVVTVAFNPAAIGAKTGSIKFPVTYSDKTTTTLTATLAGKGIADGSKVVVSPSSGQFDVQVVGTTSDSSETLTFTLTDTGNLPVKIATSTITSNFSFVSDSCSGTTVAINQACQIVVAFSPTKTGSITGTLTIPDNAAGNPHKVALVGTGIAASQQIVLSQTSIAFGNQVVSTKSSAVYVLVSNQSGATVPVSSVVLGGVNPTDFVESDSCTGTSIPGHSNCQIIVQFFPSAASLGVRSATITETDAASGSPRVISLSGTGVASAPSVALYPATINFGTQALGTKSAAQTFSVTNTGTTSLTITKVASSNATEFPVGATLCTGKTIAPGANCLVTVNFDPNAGSTQTATISVTDNAAGSPQTLTVSGVSVGVPQAKLTPTTLTFASQGVGITSAAQTITLSNAGTDTLQIASIAISGTNASSFKQTNTCGTSIVAAATCTISVTFDPAAVGSSAATITVTDNAGNTTGSAQTATLSGTGTGVPKVSFSPTSLTFASTKVGASSTAQAVTVSNTGTAPLPITSIAITPTGNFTQTNTCSTSVAAGGTCTISVIFSPTVAGTLTAAVSVADGATGSPQSIALSGTAAGVATATLSATSIAFPNQAVGVVSTAHSVTLTNTGSGSLIVTALKLSGANSTDFAETSSACPGTLAPAAACTINVTFKPAAAGARSATLTITDNTGNVAGSTQTVALTGTGAGTPQATLSTTTMTFASDPIGTAEGPQSITLKNTGNGPLQVTSVAVSGTNPSDFLEFDTCTPTVAAAGSCEIALYFIPTASGTRTATVVVTDNAGNVSGAKQTLTVTGTATGTPQATLSLTTMAFGTVKVGTQANGQAVTLTNTGNSPLTVTSVALTGTDPGDYSLFNTCSSVSEGSSCIAVVFFKPTATGPRPATLTFTDNANNVAGTKQTVTLTGTGD